MSKKLKSKNALSSEQSSTLIAERDAERFARPELKVASRHRRDHEEDSIAEEERVMSGPHAAADARFAYIAAAILAIGVGLRLVLLQAPPFMHDEAIHAMFAYNFESYKYDPVYHGPLLYYLVAAVFAILGDYDFTARLIPALMGIGLIILILGPARRWIGERAALWSAALVAISPSMVAYHRRLLHDALVLVLTLGVIFCFQLAREHASRTPRGRLARLGLVALVALFLCTKANAFFIVAMLFSFGVATLLSRFFKRSSDNREARENKWLAFIPVVMLATVAFASMTAIRESANVSQNEGMFYVVCFLCSFTVWFWLSRGTPPITITDAVDGIDVKDREATDEREPLWLKYDWQTPMLGFGLLMLILAFFYGDLYIWWREPLQIPKHLADTMGAIPGMIKYWGGQQRAPRLASRHDYYIILMLIYELPIVIAALGGIWRASRTRSAFTDLLIWWSFTSFTLYAMANEKVPWLLPHILLPLILLGGWWLAQLRFRTPARRTTFAVACLLGAIFLVRGVSATNFERGLDHHEPMFFAHTTEGFRDSFLYALSQNRERKDWLWIDGSYQWPMAWYLRDSEKRYNAKIWWGVDPPKTDAEGKMRMAAASVPKYVNNPLFAEWKKWSYNDATGRVELNHEPPPDLAVWPRAAWGALRLDRFPIYWWNREASEENGILYEDSHQEMIIATAP